MNIRYSFFYTIPQNAFVKEVGRIAAAYTSGNASYCRSILSNDHSFNECSKNIFYLEEFLKIFPEESELIFDRVKRNLVSFMLKLVDVWHLEVFVNLFPNKKELILKGYKNAINEAIYS
jgi:hypothetical protein